MYTKKTIPTLPLKKYSFIGMAQNRNHKIRLILVYCGLNSPIRSLVRWHLVLTTIRVLSIMYGRA